MSQKCSPGTWTLYLLPGKNMGTRICSSSTQLGVVGGQDKKKEAAPIRSSTTNNNTGFLAICMLGKRISVKLGWTKRRKRKRGQGELDYDACTV